MTSNEQKCFVQVGEDEGVPVYSEIDMSEDEKHLPPIVRQCLIDWMIQALRDISEDMWSAGWYSEIEHFAWDAMHGKKVGGFEWCHTQRELRKLKEVSKFIEVWVRWDKNARQPVPVEIGVWEHLHKAWSEKQQ